jgi:hypothetical protein
MISAQCLLGHAGVQAENLAPVSRIGSHEAADQAVCLSLQTLTFTGVSLKWNKVSCSQELMCYEASVLDLWSLNFSWLGTMQTPSKHQFLLMGYMHTLSYHIPTSHVRKPPRRFRVTQ